MNKKIIKMLPHSKEDINRVLKSNLSCLKTLMNMINANGWLTDEQVEIFDEMFKNLFWIEDEIGVK